MHTFTLFKPTLLRLLLLVTLCSVAIVPVQAQESMTLNLKEADIQSVISTVSRMTGKNFIVDPRVKGRVTIISAEPVEAEELYQIFLSVLDVHGFAAIPDKNAVKIVPAVTAKQMPVTTATDRYPGKGDEIVTRIFQVVHSEANQLVPLLRPLLPQESHLAAYAGSNVLIASATAANLNRLASLLDRIDRSADGDVEIIRLEHASAEEIARLVSAMQGNSPRGANAGSQIVADVRTNSVIISGDQGYRIRMRAMISHLDTPLERAGGTEVYYLRYGDAEEMATLLQGMFSDNKANGKEGNPTKVIANIQPDTSTNALIITAAPDIMNEIEGVIRRLDIRRAQVMVEAVIAEVSVDAVRELGVQWGYDGSSNDQPIGVINFSGSGNGLANLLSSPPAVADGLSLLVGDTSSSGGNRIGALLNALAGDAESNILSTPTLVTLDNEEAEIVVGQNVPFVTGSYSNTGNTGTPTNPFQTINREDIGITLKIKPQINEGDAVRLEIAQEVSSISSATTGAADLITNKRSIKTTVMANHDEVVVLGGLIDDQVRESSQKVPGLGDIPLLGWLFSYKKTSKVKRNLMVFLHPVIMRDSQANAAVTGSKYHTIRDAQLAMKERGIDLMDDAVSPMIPDWEQFSTLPPPYKEKDASSDNGMEQPPAMAGARHDGSR